MSGPLQKLLRQSGCSEEDFKALTHKQQLAIARLCWHIEETRAQTRIAKRVDRSVFGFVIVACVLVLAVLIAVWLRMAAPAGCWLF